MPLTSKQLQASQKMIKQMAEVINKQSHCCAMMSDPTRIKLLLAIKQFKELSVSEIAKILQITVSAVSHQLKNLEIFGAINKRKKGQQVFYSLNRQSPVVQCLYNFQKQRL